MDNIGEILRLFGLDAENYTAEKINSGHINLTYRVALRNNKYILQRLNPSLFICPDKIMTNIALICKKAAYPLNFLYCSGKNYIVHNGAVWRIYEFIPHSVSYDLLDDLGLIYEFGRILGRFHNDTSAIAPDELYVTIEDFHNTQKRIYKLLSLPDLFEELRNSFEKLIGYADRFSGKNIPLKTAHNDVKCSNVLFDKNMGRALALIDPDTVMPGYYAFDIGDGVRSGCVDNERIDTHKLKAFLQGYFSAGSDAPSAEEIFLGIVCVTAELSARYLYDAMSGENYFSDKSWEQKILRGEQLLRLAVNTAENETEIINIIGECS